MAKKIFSDSHASTNGKVTTPTIALYQLALFYGYFLINDLYVRPTKSQHANIWEFSTQRNDFVEFISQLPVPEHMVPILEQYNATTTERTPNVVLIPSAAGFNHNTYFGRFIPLIALTEMHDCICRMPGNSSREAILGNLFTRQLYTTPAGHNDTFTCTWPDLLGHTYDTGNTVFITPSKWNQIFEYTFTPVLFRDFQRRSSLAPIRLTPPEFESNNPNAYDMLFSVDSSNLQELKIVLQAVASVIKSSVTMKHTLVDICTSGSTMNAFVHGYTGYALPTWCSNAKTTLSIDGDKKINESDQKIKDFARKIQFLQKLGKKKPELPGKSEFINIENLIIDPENGKPTTDYVINPNEYNHPQFLFNLEDDPSPYPSFESDLIIFDEHQHVVPQVYVLDVLAMKATTAHLATLTGKIIESFEIDGTTVPRISEMQPLGLQNSVFSDSAIPLSACIRGTSWYPRTAVKYLPPLRRAVHRDDASLRGSTLFVDRTQIVLPTVNPTIYFFGDNFGITTRQLPGFTIIPDFNILQYVKRFLGVKTIEQRAPPSETDDLTNIPRHSLYVWSPYTITTRVDRNDLRNDNDQMRTYFLTNLVTIFGTDTNFIRVEHPYNAMPVV